VAMYMRFPAFSSDTDGCPTRAVSQQATFARAAPIPTGSHQPVHHSACGNPDADRQDELGSVRDPFEGDIRPQASHGTMGGFNERSGRPDGRCARWSRPSV
jgi:hypothetical protein